MSESVGASMSSRAVIRDRRPRDVLVLERKALMSRLIAEGVDPSDVVDRVVSETGCSTRAAWYTWKKRHVWMPILVDAQKDVRLALREQLKQIRESRSSTFRLFHELTENPDLQVKALAQIGPLCDREFEILRLLGFKEP